MNEKKSINYNNSIAKKNLFCKLEPFNIYRGFHSSVCMLSDKELELRFNKLKEYESSNMGNDISLSSEKVEEMKSSILNLKNEISNNEVSAEFKKVSDYLNDSSDNTVSSFKEVFPNYVKDKLIAEKEDSKVDSVFDVVKEISKFFEDCLSKGGSSHSCIEQLKLSNIVEKVKSNSDKSEELKQIVGNEIMKDLSILEQVGNITLSDVYNKSKELKDKFNITINPNYAEIGLSLVSYGLLIKSYNKYVASHALPNVNAEELKILKSSRTFSRY
jgi:hypothetical protein